MKLPELINQVIPCIQTWQKGFNLALFPIFVVVVALNEYSCVETDKNKKKEMCLSSTMVRLKKIIPSTLPLETKCSDNFLIERKQLSYLKRLFQEEM